MPDIGFRGDTIVEGRESDSDEISRLRDEISRSRRRLGSSLVALEHRVQEGVNWRHWVRAHPLSSIAVMALAGYMVGRWHGRAADTA